MPRGTPRVSNADRRAVRAYLDRIEEGAGAAHRGRRQDRARLEAKLASVTGRLTGPCGTLERLGLVQRRRDLEALLGASGDDGRACRDAFVAAAARYGEAYGIDYETWRAVGVPAAVLRDAGVLRARREAASARVKGEPAR